MLTIFGVCPNSKDAIDTSTLLMALLLLLGYSSSTLLAAAMQFNAAARGFF